LRAYSPTYFDRDEVQNNPLDASFGTKNGTISNLNTLYVKSKKIEKCKNCNDNAINPLFRKTDNTFKESMPAKK
jgi:hypothetical protein